MQIKTTDAVDYEFDIQITVRRRTSRYDSDTLTNVHAQQQLTMVRRDVAPTLNSLIDEAYHKARRALEIKDGFELDMLALNSGDESITAE